MSSRVLHKKIKETSAFMIILSSVLCLRFIAFDLCRERETINLEERLARIACDHSPLTTHHSPLTKLRQIQDVHRRRAISSRQPFTISRKGQVIDHEAHVPMA